MPDMSVIININRRELKIMRDTDTRLGFFLIWLQFVEESLQSRQGACRDVKGDSGFLLSLAQDHHLFTSRRCQQALFEIHEPRLGSLLPGAQHNKEHGDTGAEDPDVKLNHAGEKKLEPDYSNAGMGLSGDQAMFLTTLLRI